jgi:hypothetical protein
MKWPHVAAHTRAGIADALATITPVLIADAARRPPASVLRTALYGWAFNLGRSGSQAASRSPRCRPGRGATRCR